MADEWKDTWDWAEKVWGDNTDYSFHHFFRARAAERARERGLEEMGSSDVWHISYWAVKMLKESGKVTTREQLIQEIRYCF